MVLSTWPGYFGDRHAIGHRYPRHVAVARSVSGACRWTAVSGLDSNDDAGAEW